MSEKTSSGATSDTHRATAAKSPDQSAASASAESHVKVFRVRAKEAPDGLYYEPRADLRLSIPRMLAAARETIDQAFPEDPEIDVLLSDLATLTAARMYEERLPVDRVVNEFMARWAALNPWKRYAFTEAFFMHSVLVLALTIRADASAGHMTPCNFKGTDIAEIMRHLSSGTRKKVRNELYASFTKDLEFVESAPVPHDVDLVLLTDSADSEHPLQEKVDNIKARVAKLIPITGELKSWDHICRVVDAHRQLSAEAEISKEDAVSMDFAYLKYFSEPEKPTLRRRLFRFICRAAYKLFG